MAKIKIVVSGAAGKMGREVVKAISKEKDLELVGAVDPKEVGADAGALAGIGLLGVQITPDLGITIRSQKPEVVVDFTHPSVVMGNLRTILENKVHAVIGTTGITEENLTEIKSLCEKNKINAIIAPNFAIGAVLMMKFAKEAARYMPKVEIIELHHDQKADAPSGTALKTAEMILEEEAMKELPASEVKETEKLDGVRGGTVEKIHIHSIRLPGLVAHQEVIFGGVGQTLTIRHDSISRESFMPGVILAIRKVREIKGLIYGLEHLL